MVVVLTLALASRGQAGLTLMRANPCVCNIGTAMDEHSNYSKAASLAKVHSKAKVLDAGGAEAHKVADENTHARSKKESEIDEDVVNLKEVIAP